MTDREFMVTVAKELVALRELVNAQTELLKALSEQQGQLNGILQDWCEAMEAELGENDPFGLFDEEEGDAESDLQP